MTSPTVQVGRIAFDMLEWEVHRLRNLAATMLLVARSLDPDIADQFDTMLEDVRHEHIAELARHATATTRPQTLPWPFSETLVA